MSAKEINLLPEHARPLMLSWWVIGSTIASVALVAWLGARLAVTIDEANALEGQVSALRLARREGLQRAAERVHVPQPALPDAYVAAVNEAVGKLNLPWRDLFDLLEAATPTTIALIALEPDASAQRLVITAESPGYDGMLEYVTILRSQPMATEALLLRHEMVQAAGRSSFRFQVGLHWAGTTRQKP